MIRSTSGFTRTSDTGAEAGAAANGFAWIDANKDGSITPAEIDAWTAARFPKLDLDKDGFVTKAEARKIQEAAAKKR